MVPGGLSLKQAVSAAEECLTRHRRYIDDMERDLKQLVSAQKDFVEMGKELEAKVESMSEHLCHCNRPISKSPVEGTKVSLEDDDIEDLYVTPEEAAQRLPGENPTRYAMLGPLIWS